MDTFILILFVAALAGQQCLAVVGQDVDVRTTGGVDKVSPDGGHAGRNTYTQRPLSSHRMMHFGKKGEERQAPSIPVPEVVPPMSLQPVVAYHQPAKLAPIMPRLGQSYFSYPQLELDERNQMPITLIMETESGQQIQSVLPTGEPTFAPAEPNFAYNYFGLVPNKAEEFKILNTLINRYLESKGQKSAPLMEKEDAGSNSNDKEQLAAQQDDGQQQHQQEQTPQDISVATRSIQLLRGGNRINLPNNYANYLFGRQSPSSYGYYNKKAEPKDNFFMHFGRK